MLLLILLVRASSKHWVVDNGAIITIACLACMFSMAHNQSSNHLWGFCITTLMDAVLMYAIPKEAIPMNKSLVYPVLSTDKNDRKYSNHSPNLSLSYICLSCILRTISILLPGLCTVWSQAVKCNGLSTNNWIRLVTARPSSKAYWSTVSIEKTTVLVQCGVTACTMIHVHAFNE